ncbi:peptidase S41 family protein-like protein [Lindgomyces ingoldianus]|uniref:Peptidase S41 family protein-like protein n=1 Tax=Lindgomyces ingoldianus TaxID=673940 RepID=A0ACB6Q9N8_9PLEO|nr:peptidase S41 family protein-like protein [Lindgomyces ingoldianus]KAF2463622.1 peptidase S41 family protein-like protein [Lindgomyces ingoldianus]
MRSSALLVLTGFIAAVTNATPVAPALPQALPQLKRLHIRQDNTTNSTAPCAQVSQAIYSNGGPASSIPTVPAKIAYECIQSVPFNATSAMKLLDSLPPYLAWQSTLTVLSNPPDEYAKKVQPPVDILGGVEKLKASIGAGQFKSEYEFGWALYTLIQSAHDGHFTYVPDSVGSIFNFGRPVPLVSVSEDGKKLPAVFAYYDVLGMQFKNISYTPSPIVQINGQDVNEYLEGLSQYGSLQDRDALYNNMFYELAQISLGSSGSGTGMFTGGGRGRWVYPGPTTTLKFANETSYTMENYARVLQSFRGINTGEELATQWFYYGSNAASTQLGESASPAALAVTAPGYPTPVTPGPSNLINGFYVDAPGYEDVAVLQVPNFVGETSVERAFQKTTQDFLPKAVADGKTKLIIDVQANGGGTILQGYDMFKQLFPSILPYGANRFRATEYVDLIGQAFSAYASKFPRQSTYNQTLMSIQGSYFDYHQDSNENYERFTSWADKFGPIELLGDKFTNIARWNLSDVLITYNSGGINITGYGIYSNASSNPPPFKAENIVILTDGYCASTCTIFAELMKQQGGVKTIAMGGRSNKNPIQAIGGVKGTNNYAWNYIQNLGQQAVEIAPEGQDEKYNTTFKPFYANIPYNRAATNPGANVRDGLRQNDTSGVPLQFIYEEADCRLYYTPEMTVDATAIWKAAADAQWGGKGNCVTGGGYGTKREAHEVTTSLKPRRVSPRAQASLLQQFEAFEKSFVLQTDCTMHGDGFMHP